MNKAVISTILRICILFKHLDNVWKHKANNEFFWKPGNPSSLHFNTLLLTRLVFCKNASGPLLITSKILKLQSQRIKIIVNP